MDTQDCNELILASFITDSSLKMILSLVQFYCLIRILLLAKANKQRMHEACCTNLTYALIITFQFALCSSLIMSSCNQLAD